MRFMVALSSVCFLLNTQLSFGYRIEPNTCELSILTPSLQDRKTMKVVLDNGLKVYLISDPKAQESAAALSVHIGSWSDPKEYPGMAHFLEHMLFMGTNAYPDENAFSQFIAEHGGSSNAYTSLDRTVYSFTSNHEAFSKALNIFSHFFIDPLFKTSEVGRELHAIDQEHAKNIHNDFRRQWMIFKEQGNPSHPNCAFATGSAETLGHVPRKALVDWYEKNYSSDLMQLVIYSPLPLDELLQIVNRDFSAVKKREHPSKPSFDVLTSAKQYGVITYIEPVKDLKILSIDWELPQTSSLCKEAFSAEVIAAALNDASSHGLCEYLKSKHLIESLQAGVSVFSSENRFLSMSLSLTKEGILRIQEVIQDCFSYLELIKNQGIPSHVFDEMKSLSTIHYQYQSREKAFEYVTKTAHELLDETLASYPQKTVIPKSYDQKEVHSLLQGLTPSKTLFTVLAPKELTQVKPTLKEKWNQGEYSVVALDKSFLSSLDHPKKKAQLHLPQSNPYIPQHLTLSPLTETSTYPIKLKESKGATIYFWQDHEYLTPESDYLLAIKSPQFNLNTRSHVLCDLMIKAFYHQNAPLLAKAEEAGLFVTLEAKSFTLFLKIKGYSEKASDLTLDVIQKLKNVLCTPHSFELYKESLLSSYYNQKKAQPYTQAGEFLSSILYNDAKLSSEKAAIITHVGYEEFVEFTKKFFEKTYLDALICGNLSKQEGEKFSASLSGLLSDTPYLKSEHLVKKVLILDKEQGPFKLTEKIDTLGNATLLALWQGSFSFEKKACQLVLATLLSDHFFNTLRSQQQTGYITASWAREVEQELLQFFLVQSATHQPEDLLARFELFIEGYAKDFSEKISLDRFEEVKKNSIETLEQKPANLDEQADIFFHQAFERKGLFTFRQELLATLKELNYDTFKHHSLSALSRKNKQRVAMLVEGELHEGPFIYEEISLQALKEKGKYVSSSH